MTVDEFLENHNGSAIDDEELAEIASDVEGEIGILADSFLSARTNFMNALEDAGYEVG